MEQDSEMDPTDAEDVLIHAIVSALSEADAVDDAEPMPPLNDVVDPDALVRLLHDAEETTRVTFQYRQCEVEVRGGGVVEVTDPGVGE